MSAQGQPLSALSYYVEGFAVNRAGAIGPGAGWAYQRTIALSAGPPTANYQVRIDLRGGSVPQAGDQLIARTPFSMSQGVIVESVVASAAAATLGNFSVTLSTPAPRTRIYLPLISRPG